MIMIKEYVKRLIPDYIFLKIMYKRCMGKKLNLRNPQTFNEKLQWLKLYDRNPEYTKLVDKYEAKKYVADKIGEEYIIPTIGIWNRFEDIDFDSLPQQFVLKTTHDSGGVVICKDKDSFDYDKAKEKIKKSLKTNYYYVAREWPYKNVYPRIIAEEYVCDKVGNEGLTDYKFFCFNGKVDYVMVCVDRHVNSVKYYFYDRNWELQRINECGLKAPKDFTISKPPRIEAMFAIAEKLSKKLPFVRCDLYASMDRIYFGEFTFFSDAGFDRDILPKTDMYFGNLLNLNFL